MTTSNPVSPKVIAAGIGAIVLPILVSAVIAIIDALSASDIFAGLSPVWQGVIQLGLGALGAVLAAYRKTDPLRLPTLEQEAVDELDEPPVP